MELLKQTICNQSTVLSETILKVDGFINHQIDVNLMDEIGKEFKRRFANEPITKIVTVESSGIAPAYATAREFGVDVVFARKNQSLTLNKNSSDLVYTEIFSYTKNVTTGIYISKKYLNENDTVLIIDDFLANGEVAKGLLELVGSVGAKVVGFGILIEKSFQKGRAYIESTGTRVESLARVQSLENNTVQFVDAD